MRALIIFRHPQGNYGWRLLGAPQPDDCIPVEVTWLEDSITESLQQAETFDDLLAINVCRTLALSELSKNGRL